jgi:hypothetical protein
MPWSPIPRNGLRWDFLIAWVLTTAGAVVLAHALIAAFRHVTQALAVLP